jgi:hypothetical protein
VLTVFLVVSQAVAIWAGFALDDAVEPWMVYGVPLWRRKPAALVRKVDVLEAPLRAARRRLARPRLPRLLRQATEGLRPAVPSS